MGGWIQPGPAEKDQARREGRQTAGQVGADPRGASRYDDNVSGVQLPSWRIAEDRGGQVSLRGEDLAFAINELHRGATLVQSGAQGQGQVGVPVDFQRAKLDRGVFLGGAQKQSEQPLLQQPTRSVGILAGMNQDDELPGR
jgi:hypothetical protein